jgi:ATP synthase F1 epsilon subunit
MAEEKQVKKIFIRVVSPEEKVFEGYADFINVPAKSGSLGILPRHAAIIAQLKTGILKIVNDSKPVYIGVCRGYFEFIENRANVITERAIITSPEKREETIAELKSKHDIIQEITEDTRKVVGALAGFKNLRH